jgi:hypothetical protein
MFFKNLFQVIKSFNFYKVLKISFAILLYLQSKVQGKLRENIFQYLEGRMLRRLLLGQPRRYEIKDEKKEEICEDEKR